MAPSKKAAASSSATQDAAPKSKKTAKPKSPQAQGGDAPLANSDVPAVESVGDAVEAVAEAASVPEATTPVTVDSLVTAATAHFTAAEKELRTGRGLLKKLAQLHNKEIKAAATAIKNGRRKRPRDPNAPKKPASGIAKPGNISTELADFLNVGHDVQLARTDVIKQLAGYVKANHLENPSNRKEIVADDALTNLLGSDSVKDTLTYFTMQKHLAKHFPKAVAAAAQ